MTSLSCLVVWFVDSPCRVSWEAPSCDREELVGIAQVQCRLSQNGVTLGTVAQKVPLPQVYAQLLAEADTGMIHESGAAFLILEHVPSLTRGFSCSLLSVCRE